MKKTLTLGKKVRIARLLRGYSQENIASELGIKQQTFQLMENGQIYFSKERFERICRILDLEVGFVGVLDDIDLLNKIVHDYLKSIPKQIEHI